MKAKFLLAATCCFAALFSSAQLANADLFPVKKSLKLSIQPIWHASLVMNYDNKTVYVDPTGGAEAYEGLPDPDVILITDINEDHFDLKTIEALHTANSIFVVPALVAEWFPETIVRKQLVVFENGDRRMLNGIGVAAIPRYNLPESEDAFYPRGRGNGYVVGIGGKNIYISGESDAVPEIKELRYIDIAFISMNKPYTMNAKQAAETVLDIKPAIVYPYDFIGQDVSVFKDLVNSSDPSIEVRVKNWYGLDNTAASR